MNKYNIIRKSNLWSTKSLTRQVEMEINKHTNLGKELVSVSFGFNIWLVPTAFITFKTVI